MKKFARFLGFLGFFATLTVAQIGTAFGAPERVECPAGKYLPAEGPGVEITGPESCVTCEGVVEIDGVLEGVFCRGGVFFAPYTDTQGRELCRYGKCNTENNHWTLTEAGATSASDCKGECEGNCIWPNSNCPLSNNNSCGYNTHVTKPGTVECYGTCDVENIPENYCPVTCPTECEARCICPRDGSQSGSCPGYDTNVTITGAVPCGQTSCDVTQNIYGNPTTNNGRCPQTGTCWVKCVQGTCPEGTSCEWDLDSNGQQGNQSGDDCVDTNGDVIQPATCNYTNVKCENPCEYWDENQKQCVAYTSHTYYKCQGQTTLQGPDAVCGQDFAVNRINANSSTAVMDLSSCVPDGYTFTKWELSIDYSPYNNHLYDDGERFSWGAPTNNAATFEAQWDSACYEVSFNDIAHGGSPNDPNGTHVSFYKKYNDTQYNWYTDDNCTEKVSGGAPSVAGYLPTKEHATFTGYYYETPNPDRQIFNANGNLTTGTNSGSDWTITGTTPLYAQYSCVAGYTQNSNGDCVGNSIDVKYVCVSPIENGTNITGLTETTTYGTSYGPIRSVGTGNHSVQCAFTGYELPSGYDWVLQQFNDPSNPDSTYEPSDTFNEWQYLTTSPQSLTEITFQLDKSFWQLKTYTVEYRCGTIKPNAAVYTDSSATYGQTYNVAGQFDQFNGSNVTVQDFLDNNCKPDGGFGAWTFQNWTFTCHGANAGPYVTNDPNFGNWTYDYNDCYFTANWAQTDFVITLDSNINQNPMNSNSNVSNPTSLYTRHGDSVYMCSERNSGCEMTSSQGLHIPTKVVNIKLYGNGGTFDWTSLQSGTTQNDVGSINDALELSFLGFYRNHNDTLYIDTTGYITSAGKEAGIGYDANTNPDELTWVAHWENGTITLPEPVWAGHTFQGWYTTDGTEIPDMGTYVFGAGTYNQVSENLTLYARWTETCYTVTFNENGGTASTNGTHGNFYKKYNNIVWYSNATCTTIDSNPTVAGHLPTKYHAKFIGYYDEVPTPNSQIFYGVDGNGGLTADGSDWTITDDAELVAHYECNFPYHEENGACVTCDPSEFYDPEDPTDPCKTCNDILQPITGISGWTSQEPYNWSIKQCYRVCGSGTGIQETCTVVDPVSGYHMEQFLPDALINGNTGKQISFYGNEYDNGNTNFNTCLESTGVQYCPQGLLSENDGGATFANKNMAAEVVFYGKTSVDGNYEKVGSRYIVGGRSLNDGVYTLNSGFAWSQVVGNGQLSDTTLGNLQTISIIYPALYAPEATSISHSSFGGYGYPENGQTMFVNNSGELTAGSTGNANSIITYANANSHTNMSPIIGDSNYTRNLYAQYTEIEYRIDYDCARYCPTTVGGTVPESETSITYGQQVIPAGNTCTCAGREFGGWKVSNTNPEEMQQPGVVFTWQYDENKIFYADWGTVSTKNIDYRKLPDEYKHAST